MTFKKDYNELLLFLLCGLVRDALHFGDIVGGSSHGPDHVRVRVRDLQNKVWKYLSILHTMLGNLVNLQVEDLFGGAGRGA